MNFISEKAEQLKDTVSTEELEAMTRTATISDAMRLGSTVTDQMYNGFTAPHRGEACALSAALISVTAFVKK